MQWLCNHKTGIHEVIVLEFEIRTVCRDKSNIDFVLGQYRKEKPPKRPRFRLGLLLGSYFLY